MKLNKKTLMYAGIGVAVLVIGYLAFKKFGKKNQTDADATEEVEEEVVEETKSTTAEQPTKSTADNKAQMKSAPAIKTQTKSLKLAPAVKQTVAKSAGSDNLFKKFGITEVDYDKMKSKEREIAKKYSNKRLSSNMPKISELREFAEKNNISYGAYKKAGESKLEERSAKVKVTETSMTFSDFMDFDGLPDVQSQLL